MSDIDSRSVRPGSPLSASLRELGRSAPRGAPPELGVELSRAFHRHYLRRRIARAAFVSGLAIMVCASLLLLRAGSPRPTTARQPVPAKANAETITEKSTTILALPENTQIVNNRAPRLKPRAAARVVQAQPFIALPALALRLPDEELHVIRVEMPVSSLRLLGAQVSDEPSARRVTTDLLVGPDGTPYAFRLGT